MAISYTETVVTTTKVEKTFNVDEYKTWSCFTSQANNAMYQKAKRFVAKMEKMQSEKYSHSKYCNAFKSFINSYRRFQDTKMGREAGASDTAVRECVWGFLVDISKAINFDFYDLDRIWDENY